MTAQSRSPDRQLKPNLRILNLQHTNTKSLAFLQSQKELVDLNIQNTKVTVPELYHLRKLSKLRRLSTDHAQVARFVLSQEQCQVNGLPCAPLDLRQVTSQLRLQDCLTQALLLVKLATEQKHTQEITF